MFAFASDIEIDAPPERVWALLTDAAAYPTWNPTVTEVRGEVALGRRIVVHAAIANGKGFPVRVAVLDAPRRMVWRGGAPLRFLFRGERVFTLTPAGQRVHFSMREEFSGLLAGLIRRSFPDLQPAFDDFEKALKRAAEAPPA